MNFIETRGNDGKKPSSVPFSEAILDPITSFGGLYVPDKLPKLDDTFLIGHLSSGYKELALAFLTMSGIDIEIEILEEALKRYDAFDNPSNPVPVIQIEDNLFVSELYHGQTRSFKDMALKPFGYILSKLAQERDENYLIMAATSGDTGPATLETFKNQDNVKVACLYPDGGTSDVQKLQMTTEDADNIKVIGVKGDFDDTQHVLKEILASEDFKSKLEESGFKVTAANSVNFGRIIFQIIYHVHSYLEVVRKKEIRMCEKINLVVPSGNFGNALGAYYAKKAGLPINKIIIASNSNSVLTDFVNEGEYNIVGRELIKTDSPAMDILKSSNVERILFDKFGARRTKELMEELDKKGKFQLSYDEMNSVQKDFLAFSSNDENCSEVIYKYAKKGYFMDTHTATCIGAYEAFKVNGVKTVMYSTAEFTKFAPAISKVFGYDGKGGINVLKFVAKKADLVIHENILELFKKPVVHNTVVGKVNVKDEVIRFIYK